MNYNVYIHSYSHIFADTSVLLPIKRSQIAECVYVYPADTTAAKCISANLWL